MKTAFLASRELLKQKPPHGAPCTRCGLCCVATLCPLALHVFGERAGPCPALLWDAANKSACRLTTDARLPEPMRAAALHLIGSGTGCDARFNGEPINHAFYDQLREHDRLTAKQTSAAREQWRMA